MMIARGPRTLAPGESMDVWAAMIVGRAPTGLPPCPSSCAGTTWSSRRSTSGFLPACRCPPRARAPPPSSLRSFPASAQPGAAEIEWEVSGANAAQVQRAAPDEGWQAMGEATVSGTGRVRWQDTGVVPGVRYGYRLALGAGGGAPFAGETWLDIPRTARLAIAGFSPNPGAGPTTIRFSLAGGGRAQVQVLDLAGRRVYERDVTELGPGAHAVPLGKALSPGIYWLELSQGGTSVSARGILVR